MFYCNVDIESTQVAHTREAAGPTQEKLYVPVKSLRNMGEFRNLKYNSEYRLCSHTVCIIDESPSRQPA